MIAFGPPKMYKLCEKPDLLKAYNYFIQAVEASDYEAGQYILRIPELYA